MKKNKINRYSLEGAKIELRNVINNGQEDSKYAKHLKDHICVLLGIQPETNQSRKNRCIVSYAKGLINSKYTNVVNHEHSWFDEPISDRNIISMATQIVNKTDTSL